MDFAGRLRCCRFAAALVVAIPIVPLAQSDAVAIGPKRYTVMTGAQVIKMLGAVGDAKSLRVEIYSVPQESPIARPPDSIIFTRLCRIDNSNEQEKVINWISELRPVQPTVPAGNSPMSMMLLGGYGPFVLKVIFWRGHHQVFSGIFSLPGFDDKSSTHVSIGVFSGYRVGSFAVEPVLKIESYMKSPSDLGNCADI